MPLYEYRCRRCDEEFEERVRMDTPTETIECPGCGVRDAERLLSTFSSRGCGGSGHDSTAGGASCAPRGGFT